MLSLALTIEMSPNSRHGCENGVISVATLQMLLQHFATLLLVAVRRSKCIPSVASLSNYSLLASGLRSLHVIEI